MLYLIAELLGSLFVASALGAIVGWLAKAMLAARREQVWRRELRHSEARAGNLKNQLAEAKLVEERLREDVRGLEAAGAGAGSSGGPERVQHLKTELARRDTKIKLLQLQATQSEAAVASEWQSLKAVKSEISERQQRLAERGKQVSGKLKDSEEKQQQLRLQLRSMKRQSERLQEQLKASQRALADERRKSAASRARLESKLARLETKHEVPAAEEAIEVPAAEELPDDDLEQIRGIGPVLSRKLKGAGVTSFRQIASWTDGDLVEVASKIGSAPGRIRRDGWVAAARKLLQ